MFLNKIKPRLRSIRAQLIAYSIGLFGLTLLGFSAFLYQAFTQNIAREFDADLLNYAVDVIYSLDVNVFGEIVLSQKFKSQTEKLLPFELGETLIQLRNQNGDVLTRSQKLKNAILPLNKSSLGNLAQSGASEFRTIDRDEANRIGLKRQTYRVVNYYFERRPGEGIIAQVAAPTHVLDRERAALLTFFSVSIPIVLLVGLFGGLYLSRKALTPVTDMIDQIRELSAQKLSDRLPVPGTHDELEQLALTFNGLLNRLEEAFRSQQTFVSDASHQLKTPLAILRGEIDLMRTRARSPEEQNAFFQSASEEVGYLSRMIEDLLVLARIDTGSRSLSVSTVAVDETLVDVVARLNRLASPKHVDLMMDIKTDFSGQDTKSYFVQGDVDLIRSLFESIIENAIKYSSLEGGKVHIGLSDTSQEVEISVRDEGMGISREALPKIFDRFYRAEETCHGQPGSGLGLAIAKRIIEVHRGSIRAESEPGHGTTVRITLPKFLTA